MLETGPNYPPASTRGNHEPKIETEDYYYQKIVLTEDRESEIYQSVIRIKANVQNVRMKVSQGTEVSVQESKTGMTCPYTRQ